MSETCETCGQRTDLPKLKVYPKYLSFTDDIWEEIEEGGRLIANFIQRELAEDKIEREKRKAGKE